jgi:triacylglycerol lipase
LSRRKGEKFEDYLERILQHPFWKTEDLSAFDLSPEGARKLNARTPAKDNIYYFSWATSATYRLVPSKFQRPAEHMLPLFHLPAVVMGSCTKLCMWRDNPISLDHTWFENDGIVNTRSMRGPTLNSSDEIVKGDGKRPQTGQWNYMGLKKGWDHFDIIGLNETWPFPPSALPEKINAFYETIADLLRRLPAVKPGT